MNKRMKKKLREEEERLVDELAKLKPGTEEYHKTLENLNVYRKATGLYDKDKPIDKAAMFSGICACAQIVAILGWERLHFIGSKALGFVFKPRV